jgi:hypothetical protein
MVSDEIKARFWAKVSKGNEMGACWLWTAARVQGYGRLKASGRQIDAHRLSYELHHGPIPPGRVVMHHCDVRACVRPDHLEIGTIADNNADRDRKGRTVAGRTTTLTEAQVDGIRRRWAEGGVTQAGLAAIYGVSRSAVAQIVQGKTWRGL